jgi:asparagine synthase (glutamine-hydrolysing)
MAHSLEIRVPLVDFTLLAALAPAIPVLALGVGKTALAKAPIVPLPDEIVTRAKTGFGVPTSGWMNAAAGALEPTSHVAAAKGLVSRRWSHAVLNGAAVASHRREARVA